MHNSQRTFALTFLLQWASTSAQSDNLTYIGNIDVTDFPACAVTNCITSNQFSPSRLGCVEPELTTECFCNEALTPLSCSPEGSSDQDNCWYDLEDWFAGVCSDYGVLLLNASTMPLCMQDCVLNYLRDQGCTSQTRNCFCILPRQPIIQAASSCYEGNCVKKLESSFSPTGWHDNICNLGETDAYDQVAYDKYVTMVHKIRLSMSILVGMAFVFFVLVGMYLYAHDGEQFGVLLIALACVGVLVIMLQFIQYYKHWEYIISVPSSCCRAKKRVKSTT